MEEFPIRIEYKSTQSTVVSIKSLINHNDHNYVSSHYPNEDTPSSDHHDDAVECSSPVQDTLSMTEEMAVRACLGCLATEPKLYNLYENNLYEVFGEVVGNPVFESDEEPRHICAMCYAQLLKYVSFRTRCRMVQDLLLDLRLQGVKITTENIRQIDRNKYNLLPNLGNVTPSTSELIIHEELPDKPLSQDDEGIDHAPAETLPALDTVVVCIEDPATKFTPADKNERAKTLRKPRNTIGSSILNDPQKAEEFSKKYNMEIVFLTEEERIEEMKKKINQSTKVKDRPHCSNCGKLFKSEASLQTHIKIYHDEWAGLAQCGICKYRFTPQELLKHVCNKIKFTCRKCDLPLKTAYGAILHARRHVISRSKEYKCKYCETVFDKSDMLKSHVHIEHPDVLTWCKCCGESFLNEAGLSNHVLRVHKEFLNFHCQKCNVKFATSEALERHSSLTCDEFNCVMCGEHFETELVFKDHVIKEHSRCKYIKLAHCDGCGVKFIGTDPLVKHLGLKCCGSGHPCLVCGENFATSEDMAYHKYETHPKLHRVCESCDKAFDAHNYRHHIFRVHNIKPPQHPYYGLGVRLRTETKRWAVHGSVIAGAEPRRERPQQDLMCHYCGKTFTMPMSLKYHTLVHTGERPHICVICGQSFIRKDSLKAHERLHSGERPHACHVCPAAFRRRAELARHLLCHSEVRRHVCQMCGKSFRTSTSVKIHIRGVHLNIPVNRHQRRKLLAQNSSNKNTHSEQNQEDNLRTQGLIDGDNNKNVPVKKARRPTNRREEQTYGHIQGSMDGDITEGGMLYEADSALDTNVPRVIKTVHVKRKMKPKNSMPTSDSKENNTLAQDYMDSETYGKDIAPSSNKIRTKIKKPEIARKMKHVIAMDNDFMDDDVQQGFMDKNITQDFMNSNATQSNVVYSTLSKTVPPTAITKQINVKRRKKHADRSMPTLVFDSETQTQV